MDYGKEVILDMHECDPSKFTRKSIGGYFKELCDLIDMERCELCWWEENEGEPHLVGISAVQFIKTSNIVIHTLDILKRVYLNIFSCKNFDDNDAIQFSQSWFGGKIVNKSIIRRV